MIKRCLWFYIAAIVFSEILVSKAWAFTDHLDVVALEDLFKALNYPPQLQGWSLGGGDPCGESWTGVLCYGSSVLYLSLKGLSLSGSLGGQLHNMHSLKELDMSSNYIVGEIPYGLPPNATHLNLACNNLKENIPDSLPLMRNLRHLNLSHNSLSGPIGNFFSDLQNLREMDLSYNKFTGDLPSSFGSLKNLVALFLQNNEFTGSVIFLSELQLNQLNIQNNHFSGIVPNHFQTIPNLWIGGNGFQGEVDYPPWNFPLETLPNGQNITRQPTTESSAIETYPSQKVNGHKKKMLSPGGVASMICGVALLATCAALFIVIRRNRSHPEKLRSLGSGNCSLETLPPSEDREHCSIASEESPQILPVSSSTIIAPRHKSPVLRHSRAERTRRKSFSEKHRVPLVGKVYTLSELQSATNNFSEEKLLGEGSLGSVYKAEFPNGKILAVKNINMASLSYYEEQRFMDVMCTASQLRHPNIIELLGYCIEHGQHFLVYEYVRNVSLHDALHNEVRQPLSWLLRLWIALGVARALDYMHTAFSPPITHCNVKASNVLLDEELIPHLSDCGIAILRPFTSNKVKVKASEIAIGDTGYIAPEHSQPGNDSTKGDIYAFGVLLLELLTGRKPFDSSRPREEQSLVGWIWSRLHDSESLARAVDPRIRGTLSSKAASRFADIVSLCIQPVKEFRPQMSEIVDSLVSLLQKPNKASDCAEVDPFERSFRSANSFFVSSPTVSYLSTYDD